MRDVIKIEGSMIYQIERKKDPQQNMPQHQGPKLRLVMKQKEKMAGDRHLVLPAVEQRGGAGRGVSLLPNAQEQGGRAEKGPPLGKSEPFQFSGKPYLNSHLPNYYLP